MKIGTKVKMLTNIPMEGDELYGYMTIAKSGDAGVYLGKAGPDTDICIVRINNVNLRLRPEQFKPLIETPSATMEKFTDENNPLTIVMLLEMYGLTKLPLFKETPMGTLFDFNCIIPVSDEDDLEELWGTPYNTNETLILSEDLVTFNVADGVPCPVLEALSKMYPEKILYVSYFVPGRTEMISRLYRNGEIIREITNVPITHCFDAGVTVERFTEVMDALSDKDLIQSYRIYTEENFGFQLSIDHEDKKVYISKYDPKRMMRAYEAIDTLKRRAEEMNNATTGTEYTHPDAICITDDEDDDYELNERNEIEPQMCASDPEDFDDDEDDIMVPDSMESTGIPITNADNDVRCRVDDDDEDDMDD